MTAKARRMIAGGLAALMLAGCAAAPGPEDRNPFPEPRGWPVVGVGAAPAPAALATPGAPIAASPRPSPSLRTTTPESTRPRIGSSSPPPPIGDPGQEYRARIGGDLRSLGDDQRRRVETEAATGAAETRRLVDENQQRLDDLDRQREDLRRQLDETQRILRHQNRLGQ